MSNIIKAGDIASKIMARVIGDTNRLVSHPASVSDHNLTEGSLLWCRKIDKLNGTIGATIICEENEPALFHPESCTYLVVDNARRSFQQALQHFFIQPLLPSIASSAIIAPGVKLGANLFIGHHVVIEENCVIGDNSAIDHNSVIKSGTVIGHNVSIGCNSTLGTHGFGFEKNKDGDYELMPHVGNVIIGDHVEIGNQVTIDRAVLGSTRIGNHAKIDNHVYIAHGVSIGDNTLVIGHSMIAGSTQIGKEVWVSPGSTIINKISIGDRAVIGLGSVVISQVPAGMTVAGNPARILSARK